MDRRLALQEFSASRPLLLVGCGNMGAAMLGGWLDQGLSPGAVHIVDPVSDPLVPHKLAGVHRDPGVFFSLCEEQDIVPLAIVLAVKPQYMPQVIGAYRGKLAADCLVISIAAGLTAAFYRDIFGDQQPLVRVMPNTPAAVGLGASLACDLSGNTEASLHLASALVEAVGSLAWVDDERKIDSLTAVSGSGPAYVFLLIEALAAAGVDQGLSPAQAQETAKQVVLGAATLAMQSDKTPAVLRQNVTSPGGVTQAALDVLMAPQAGMVDLLVKGCRAGTARAVALGAP